MSLLHQVNLLSHPPLRCHPQPFPPQLWPLLPSLSQAAPRSRTGRFRHLSAQSGWPGSGRRVLSIHLSSPPATRHLLDREAFGHSGLAVLRVRAKFVFLFFFFFVRIKTNLSLRFLCTSIWYPLILLTSCVSWYRGHVWLVPAPDEQPHDAPSAAGRAVGLLAAPAHGAGWHRHCKPC